MKHLIALILLVLAVNVGAQTNTFTPGEMVIYTLPSTNLNGVSVRILPMGYTFRGEMTILAEVRRPSNIIVDKQYVLLSTTVSQQWLTVAKTNKLAGAKQLAQYVLDQIVLDPDPAAVDGTMENGD